MFKPHRLRWSLAVPLAALLVTRAGAQTPPAFRNTIDTIPSGWMGPVFELSKDYPATLPTDPKPWKSIDFKTQPKAYIDAVLAYAREGNEAANWKVQDNTIRKWYHAPGLLRKETGGPTSGREFIHGLTRERPSRALELGPA
jgi:hypothetical protein